MIIGAKRKVLLAFGILLTIALFFIAALLITLAVTKPFGVEIQQIPSALIQAESGDVHSTYDHPLLTTEQESTLESLGVDTTTIPTSITQEQINCFTEKLGEDRVKDIEAGAAITPFDYFKAKSCIK